MKPALHKFALVPKVKESSINWKSSKHGASHLDPSGKFKSPKPLQTPFTKDPSLPGRVHDKEKKINHKSPSPYCASRFCHEFCCYRSGSHHITANVPCRVSALSDSNLLCIAFHRHSGIHRFSQHPCALRNDIKGVRSVTHHLTQPPVTINHEPCIFSCGKFRSENSNLWHSARAAQARNWNLFGFF